MPRQNPSDMSAVKAARESADMETQRRIDPIVSIQLLQCLEVIYHEQLRQAGRQRISAGILLEISFRGANSAPI